MNLDIPTHQARAYTIATPLYEGPLDLLLQLIERAELDITRLALAEVTGQYLDYLHNLQEQAAGEVSAFLVIAARLIQIKSEALLPRPVIRPEGEEDPGEALARQLIAYKRFKEIAQILAKRDAAGLHTYLRLATPAKAEGRIDLSGLTLADLVEAAHSVFRPADVRPSLGTVVSAPRVTIREKIRLIAGYLRQAKQITFRRLIATRPSHLDIVVTFLAMLELIKRRLIEVNQDELFGEIELQPAGTWDDNENFDLEFGE